LPEVLEKWSVISKATPLEKETRHRDKKLSIKLWVKPMLGSIDLSLKSKEGGKPSIEEFERVSEKEQGKLYG